MRVTVSGQSGLTNANTSVLSATGSLAISGASRCDDIPNLPLPNGPRQLGGQGGVTEPHLAGPGENLKLSGGSVPQVHHEGTGLRRPGGRRRRRGALRSWTRGGNHGASAGGRSEPDGTRASRTSQHGTARHVRRLLGNGSGIHDRICVTVRRHDVLSGAWLIAPCGRHGRIAPCRPRLALMTFFGQGPRLEWAARRVRSGRTGRPNRLVRSPNPPSSSVAARPDNEDGHGHAHQAGNDPGGA